MFEELILEIQEKAIANTDLLAELAGLESYIAETYAQRCLSELVQNSDDSHSSDVKICRNNDSLIYANNGRAFTTSDFSSLCRSALSNKKRGESIGYRGIGFKSVVNICTSVIILSGELRCSFSKEKTCGLLKTSVKVPLIRVPHLLNQGEHKLCDFIEKDLPGYKTFFIFNGLDEVALRQEFESLTEEHLLFLRNIKNLEIINHETSRFFSINREDVSLDSSHNLGINSLSIHSPGSQVPCNWFIVTNKQAAVAARNNDGLPTRLSKDEALIHAFLPTQSISGLGVRVNADFSTDPSRTRLKYDEVNEMAIYSVAEIIDEILRIYPDSQDSDFWRNLIDAIIPYSQYKILELQGNKFCKILLDRLSSICKLNSLAVYAAPNIFKDIEHLAALLPLKGRLFLPASSSHLDTRRFFEIIQAPTIEIKQVISFFEETNNSIETRCASFLIRNLLDQGCTPSELSRMHVFPVSNDLSMCVNDIISTESNLDSGFVAELVERLMSPSRARRVLTEVGFMDSSLETFFSPGLGKGQFMQETFLNVADQMPACGIGNKVSDSNVPSKILDDESRKRYGIKDWRIAEELVAYYYRTQGFQVIDVSKANKGYDLEVVNGGEKLCVEVKKLSHPPKEFCLTQNEFNESIILGSSFVIALVSALKDGRMEIMLISDPYKSLSAFTTKRAKSFEFLVSGFTYSPSIIYR